MILKLPLFIIFAGDLVETFITGPYPKRPPKLRVSPSFRPIVLSILITSFIPHGKSTMQQQQSEIQQQVNDAVMVDLDHMFLL